MKKEMECRGILKHWILPENGLNNGIRFAGNPTGNCPEFMPWDNALLKYLVNDVMYHILMTSHLPRTSDDKQDERKFAMSTPAALSNCYKRLLRSGFPKAEYISHDVLRVMTALKQVVEARGAVVEGLASRNEESS